MSVSTKESRSSRSARRSRAVSRPRFRGGPLVPGTGWENRLLAKGESISEPFDPHDTLEANAMEHDLAVPEQPITTETPPPPRRRRPRIAVAAAVVLALVIGGII